MAKLMLIGEVAQVELTSEPIDGGVIAKCVQHEGMTTMSRLCVWKEEYDDLNDATEYAQDHADRGTR